MLNRGLARNMQSVEQLLARMREDLARSTRASEQRHLGQVIEALDRQLAGYELTLGCLPSQDFSESSKSEVSEERGA